MDYKQAKEIIDNIVDSAFLNARDVDILEAEKIDMARKIILSEEDFETDDDYDHEYEVGLTLEARAKDYK
mgnify:CR=1 FL=1